MNGCHIHDEPPIDVGGRYLCPACEAAALGADAPAGHPPPCAGLDWVVPAQAAHPVRNLRPVTIRLESRDIERARVLSRELGIPYQRFVRELLTRALDVAERERFGGRIGDDPTRGPEGPPALATLPLKHARRAL